MAAKFVTIYNPANGLPWRCPETALDLWLSKGFTKNPNKNSSADAKAEGKSLEAAPAPAVTR